MELADIDACWASHRQIASPRRTLVGVLCDRETEMNCAKPHAGCRNEDSREGTTKRKKERKETLIFQQRKSLIHLFKKSIFNSFRIIFFFLEWVLRI